MIDAYHRKGLIMIGKGLNVSSSRSKPLGAAQVLDLKHSFS